jgi:plastocyanin
VKAGAGGFKFDPDELHNVTVGDTVTFEFYPPDHSVARAEFNNPCVPYEYTGKNKTGFWSDTQLVKTVNDVRLPLRN